MPAASPTALPRPALFAACGTAAGLLAALTFGELAWLLLRAEPPGPPPETSAKPAPVPARLAVSASPAVSVYAGGRNAVRVRVARDGFDGPVLLALSYPGPGLSETEGTIPAGETAGAIEIVAPEGGKPGTRGVFLTARAGSGEVSATATLKLTVVAVPAAPPRLAVTVSPKVPVYQRGKNRFAVSVARGDFDGDVAVSFGGLPAGVVAPAVTVPEGKAEAIAEVFAAGDARPGTHAVSVGARAMPGGVAAAAEARATVEVLPAPKTPIDVVFALDCTGSMRAAVEGLGDALPRFSAELARGRLDARFGLVGFKDTTLAQPLKIVRVGGEKLTADVAGLREAVGNLRLSGGGGEGESSLDGIAEAADYPFRDGAARVVVLVTDGGPKRVDGRVKGTDEAAKYLRERKVDQLHVVALPEHRKAFEPLAEGAKGRHFDLKAARDAAGFESLARDLAKAITAAAPVPQEGKPEASPRAPQPSPPPVGSVKWPAPPPGAVPVEPRLEKLAPAPVAEDVPAPPTPVESQFGLLARLAWAATVATLSALALLAAQLTLIPGERPTPSTGAACYAVSLAAGAAAGLLPVVALGSLAAVLAARLGGAALFGLCLGLAVPLAERAFGRPVLLELPPDGKSPEPHPPVPVSPPPVLSKPNITPPKHADGCPGCARVIPGAPGARYCMVCDRSF
jgi:hypothetical protein